MAVIANNVRTSYGRTLPSAYVKATVTGAAREQTSLLLEVWENSESRRSGNDPLDRATLGVQNPPDIPSSNPIEYAYALLKMQPGFAGAVDA